MLAVPKPSSSNEIAPIACKSGIASIILPGTQVDWIRLLLELIRVEKLGDSTEYAHNLRPILSR
jgi:hypothetical protein